MRDPRLLTGLTILIWSFGQYVGRLISLRSAYLLLTISMVFALTCFVLYAVIFQHVSPSKLFRGIKKEYLFVGFFGFALYQLGANFCFRAFNNASEPTILNYTWPLFTVLFTAIFSPLKSKRYKGVALIEHIGIFLGFISIVFLVTKGGNITSFVTNIPGLFWGLVSGASYGLFSAYSSTVSEKDHSTFLISAMVSSLVVLGVISLQELPLVSSITMKDLFVTAINGLIIQGIAGIMWTRANRMAKEQKVSISSVASMIYFLPLFALIVISVLLGENHIVVQGYFIVSLALIFFSSFLCQKSEYVASLLYGRKKI